MTQERVGDMSVQELIQLIEATVDQRMRAGNPMPYRLSGDRPLAEIIQEMRELRIKREPGEPSVVDMIREERER